MFSWEGVLIVVRGHTRMTIDPLIPRMPGRSKSGFHRPGRHALLSGRSIEAHMLRILITLRAPLNHGRDFVGHQLATALDFASFTIELCASCC